MKKINLINSIYKIIGMFSILFAIAVTVNLCLITFSGPIEASATNYISITVAPGETLWAIAKEYKNEKSDIRNYIEEIKKINNMKNGNLVIDQNLYIPIR